MIDFAKGNGLVPVVIQDSDTLQVLMLGYMNEAAYDKTKLEQRVCFFRHLALMKRRLKDSSIDCRPLLITV